MKSPINQRDLILNIAHNLIIINSIERIPLGLLRPISHNLIKLIMIILGQVLPLLQLPLNFVHFASKFGNLDVDFEVADLAGDF